MIALISEYKFYLFCLSVNNLITYITNITSILTMYSTFVYLISGRTFAMSLPLAGFIFKELGFMIIVFNEYNVLYTVIPILIESMTGGASSFLMASFAYISDVTSAHQRALRLTVVDIAVGISVIISSMCSGLLIDGVGFYYAYFVCFLFAFVSFLYVIIFVPETIAMSHGVQFFNIKSFDILLKFILDPGVSTRRWQLNLNLVLFFFLMFVDIGLLNVTILRSIASPICMQSIDIGLFIGELYLLKNIFSFIALRLFKKRLGNSGLLLLGLTSLLLYLVGFSLASSKIWIFIGE